ncbi:hypothetical protein BW898_26840 [Bacillus cereus]|nr:hypothetical protein BW898_26840 [Bacillus cereus]
MVGGLFFFLIYIHIRIANWGIAKCHRDKILKYPQNENFLSLELVTLKSRQFFRFGAEFCGICQ